jgi:hypothetical protein
MILNVPKRAALLCLEQKQETGKVVNACCSLGINALKGLDHDQ